MKSEQSIERVLDRLNDMREELLSIERMVERIEAARQRGTSSDSPKGKTQSRRQA